MILSRNIPSTCHTGNVAIGTLLSDLVPIPDDASAAWIQCVDEGFSIGFMMMNDPGFTPAQAMQILGNERLELSNREQILNIQLFPGADLGSTFAVQFFTGRTGTPR